jgi:predicted TIM-barrel fold metal-dependent hydrolase
MPYVEAAIVHDADSHLVELPDCLDTWFDKRALARFHDLPAYRRKLSPAIFEAVHDLHNDPEFAAGAEANILLRKNYEALGAFRREDRPRALDALGFASQLVFTTFCLGNFGLDHGPDVDLAYSAATAHNRMITDFCSIDFRLLATGYVPLRDHGRAAAAAREAIDLGAKAILVESRCPSGHSPSHIGLDPVWAQAQEAGLPILFHVGGEQKMSADYLGNGLPRVKDFRGGEENFTSVSFMSIPHSIEQTLACLIIDGVMDRFPRLKFGAIELGASWLPSWLRSIDAAAEAFGKNEERLHRLSSKPSEIAARQIRVTPYPHEDVAWIIRNSSEDMLMFSSDFPHVEGGRNPLKRFNESLAGMPSSIVEKFYAGNFIDLMGQGLSSGGGRSGSPSALIS